MDFARSGNVKADGADQEVTGDPYADTIAVKVLDNHSIEDDPGITSVLVKRINDTTLEETDKREGKVISVARITLSADGKALTIVYEDKLQGTTSQLVAIKQ